MSNYEIFLYVMAFSVGASLASFINVVIYRVPEGMSVVSPPSACPNCNYSLNWYDNIPIISYLFLRGKCKKCKIKISAQYPIIEFIGGVISIALFREFNFTLEFLYYSFFMFGMLALAYIDLQKWIVPEIIVFILAIVGLGIPLVSFIFNYMFYIDILESLKGGIVGFGVIATIIVLYKLIRGIDALGWGDAYILSLVGIYMGSKASIATLFFAVVQASIVGIAMILINKKSTVPYDDVEEDDPIKDKAALPFVPFLVLGAYEYLFFGERLVRYYLNFLRNGL